MNNDDSYRRDYASQDRQCINYIASVYGDSQAAWAREVARLWAGPSWTLKVRTLTAREMLA